MSTVITILAILGGMSVLGAIVLFVAVFLVRPRLPLPDNHPETQDDFHLAMQRRINMEREMRAGRTMYPTKDWTQ